MESPDELMPNAHIDPERVLSPSQTASFEKLVAALERGGDEVSAPFTVEDEDEDDQKP